jgi:hypothetical protein
MIFELESYVAEPHPPCAPPHSALKSNPEVAHNAVALLSPPPVVMYHHPRYDKYRALADACTAKEMPKHHTYHRLSQLLLCSHAAKFEASNQLLVYPATRRLRRRIAVLFKCCNTVAKFGRDIGVSDRLYLKRLAQGKESRMVG